MYELTDASETRLLAEATTIVNARYAARTMHDEGEPLPIRIDLDGKTVETLVEGPHGPMIECSSLLRGLA